MGFDNDCIINIQSLAGEYFCPVCRLLVYPNEALQSQCTHLYCKPCLTYVVNTTRACPYDGYLVAEADSKPLTESNKALAETIGKILVHCLYHRSGCTWQGPLSECTSHCSSCTFGNSPVVCNRCGVQIVHRQVQEHAQSCPGVQAQMPQADGAKETANTATVAASDQNPASTQVTAATPQTQPSQSTAAPKSDPKLQASSNSQAQAVAQASAPTHEQWYQQQQYQQYYQQYAGYDPYQQHYQQYYPYQQQGVAQQQQQHLQGHPAQAVQQQPQTYLQPPIQPQSQPQVHLQPQTQPPTHVQTQGASQTHSHTQVNQQQQNHSTVQPHFHKSQTQPLPQGSQNSQPQPQGQPQSVQQAQVPQYQQPYSQTQQSQSQSVNPLHPSQPHPFNQPQPHLHAQSQPHPQAPSQPQPHPQAQPQPQAQNQFQLQTQSKPQTQPIQRMNPSVQPPAQNTSGPAVTGYHSYPQMQSQAHFYPPMQHVTSHQHPVPVPPQGGLQQQSQFPQPPQMRPPQSHAPMYQQQQAMPLHGQAPNIPSQHQSVQSHLQNTGHHVQQHPAMPVGQPPSQQYVQQQPFAGQPSGQQQAHFAQQPVHSHLRPQAPSHSLQQQQVYPQTQQHGMQPHLSQNLGGRPVMSNQVQSQAYLQASGGSAAAVQARATQLGTEGSKVESDIVAGSDSKSDVDNTKSIKSESVSQTKGEETDPVGEVENKSIHGGASTKNISDSEIHVKENGDALCNQAVKEEPSLHTLEQSSCGRSGEVIASLEERYVAHDKEIQDQKKANLQNVATSQPPTSLGASTLQHRPSAPSMLQAPPTGMPQHKQVPGHPPDQHRLQGPVHLHSGQQFSPRGSQFSQEAFDQGNAGPFKPSQNEPLGGRGPVADGMMVRPRGPDGYMGPHLPIHPMEPATYANQRPNYMDGRQPDMQLPGSSGQGIYGQTVRNDRFKPFPDERMNPFSMDPARRDFDNDLKKFPRPSHLGNDPGPQIGSSFPSSRPLDGVPHGFGDVVPRSLDRGHMGGHYYDNRPAPGPMLNPYRHGVNEAGERHIALREDIRPDLVHPNFHGSNPGYSRHHIDGLPPRSPPRDYPGISTHGFGGFRGGPRRGFGLEEMDARDPFYESRFPPLHSHLHRGEFDGPGNLRTGEHFRSGDFPHDTLRRGEYISQHNLRMGGPVGFEDFPVRSPMGGIPGFQNFARHPRPPGEFFGGTRHNYPKIGEPGFRSGFMLQGDVEPFENPRKRKPTSMGWCRICKVDCETVDGLDIHSQTREHQKMAMDMVRDIKQNAKKHKLKPGELSSNEETGRSRNPNSEAHEIKS